MWSDSGQKRQVLRLRQVIATTNDKYSRLRDDSDNREVKFYTKQLLITFKAEHIQNAYTLQNSEVPFGFEFVQKVSFVELNFGEKTLSGEDVKIAGELKQRKGFVLCKYCGKVQLSSLHDDKFKPEHATFSCEAQDPNDKQNFIESLYLYREFESEAIRILLPISDLAINDMKLHSLVASIQMGLKKYFKGSVEHLRATPYYITEKGENVRRTYLVLYDAVPGGTGYLRQLMLDKQSLFNMLQESLSCLNNCKCNDDASKDGCYQCLYAYKNNFDRPLISREKAKETLNAILNFKDKVKAIKSVSDIQLNHLFDSELEERFLVNLADNLNTRLKPIITSRKTTGYLLEFNGLAYEIEQQVLLGRDFGVQIESKADFIIYPLQNNKLKPIVIFTDGYAFHKDIVGRDTAQRMAIVASKHYWVWSLTYTDVLGHKNGFTNYLSDSIINANVYNPKKSS